MSPDYWSQYPPHPTWGPPSPSSELPLEYRFEQMKLLGRIEAKVDYALDRQEAMETKLDNHIENCSQPRPRRRASSWVKDLGKENWSWLAAIAVVLLQVLFNSMGQPQVAERLGSVSPRQDFGDLSR